MLKDWLIRTKSKQILGPVSKQKIIELIEKGSLRDEDEISSGNGHWFWIWEKDLLDKYIYGDETQGFNPVSEIEDVLTSQSGQSIEVSAASDTTTIEVNPSNLKQSTQEELLPSSQDLEYPDVGEAQKKEEESSRFPNEQDLEYPESVQEPPEENIKDEDFEREITEVETETETPAPEKKKKGGLYWVMTFVIFLIVGALGVVGYYKFVLKQPLPIDELLNLIVPSADAQTLPGATKKKVLWSFLP